MAKQIHGGNGHCTPAVINLNYIARAAPMYDSSSLLPKNLHFSDALNALCAYFVYPYIDHHGHEFLNCELVELVVLVTSFHFSNNRKSALNSGPKVQKDFCSFADVSSYGF
jgi:hypothetical protein